MIPNPHPSKANLKNGKLTRFFKCHPFHILRNVIRYFGSLRFFVHCQSPCCGFHVIARKRRMNTAYQDEESNWAICCNNGFAELEDYWEERWKDYYSSQGMGFF